MKCPKCGSENIDVNREANNITGANSAYGKRKGKKGISGLSVSSQNVRYKTVAVCKDCGWSWHIDGEQEEKDAQVLKGCGRGCLLLILIVIAIWILFL